MGALLDFYSRNIRETYPEMVASLQHSVFPVAQLFTKTSSGVTRQTGKIGRGWQVKHGMRIGLAGSYKYAAPGGPTMTDIGKTAAYINAANSDGTLTPYPRGKNAPHSTMLERTLTLHRGTGVFAIPKAWFDMDALDATVVKQVNDDIRSAAQKDLQLDTDSFHGYRATDAGSYPVCVLGRISACALATVNLASGSTSSYGLLITLDPAYGQVMNFQIGQELDIVATSTNTIQTGTATDGSDVRNYASGGYHVKVTVLDVDTINSQITIIGVNENTWAIAALDLTNGWYGGGGVTPAANDWIVVEGCSRNTAGRPLMTWGLRDWIKSTGVMMGGASAAELLDVDVFTFLKSLIPSSGAINGALSETALRLYLAQFQKAYPNCPLDTIITTIGVTHEFMNQLEYSNAHMSMQFTRDNKEMQFLGGWSFMGFVADGKKMNWVISPNQLKGYADIINTTAGNLRKYVPPHVGGSDQRFDGDIRFVAPLLKEGNSIWFESRNGEGEIEDLAEAPYDRYQLVCPIDPRSLSLQGLTEGF